MADIRDETDQDIESPRDERGGLGPDAPAAADDSAPRLASWRRIILVALLVSYTGYYLTRSAVSAVADPMVVELEASGLSTARLNDIAGVATAAYAIGKLPSAILADRIGGRWLLLGGMVCSVLATILLGLADGVALVAVAIVANRLVQSTGWGGLVNTASRWFPPHRMGGVMGVLALSYLFGDSIAKTTIGLLLAAGVGWRSALFIMAAILGLIAAGAAWALRSSPGDVGLPEPPASVLSMHPGSAASDLGPMAGTIDVLRPYLASPGFWMLCLISVALTVTRIAITFNLPLVLVGFSRAESGSAAVLAAGFSFFGGISVLLAGHLSDRRDRGRRGRTMTTMLAAAIVPAGLLLVLPDGSPAMVVAAVFSLLGLALMGPYAFLSGVISIDLGGKRGSATAAAVIDAAGYLVSGAVLVAVGRMIEGEQWTALSLAVVGSVVVATAGAAAYWLASERVRGGASSHTDGVS